MANSDTKPKRNRNIEKRLDSMDREMRRLYQTTYRTREDNRETMDSIVNQIDDNIDDIISRINNRSTSDISNLYLRLQRKNGTIYDDISSSIEELFSNNDLLNVIDTDQMSKSIRAEDYQYDLICKYMPKLDQALEVMKDNVLSSDSFSKEFITIHSDRSSKEFIQQFNARANIVKEKYKFEELAEEIYHDVSHYGEYFLYHVPYNVAFERLLKRKQHMVGGIGFPDQGSRRSYYESGTPMVESVLDLVGEDKEKYAEEFKDYISENNPQIQVYFNTDNILYPVVEYVEQKEEVLKKQKSLCEVFTEDVLKEDTKRMVTSDDASRNLGSTPAFGTLIAPDGFVDKSGKDSKNKVREIDGSVIHKIDRSEIFPVYIGDDFCIGYLHFDVRNDYVDRLIVAGQTYNSLTNYTTLQADEYDKQNDMLVSQIAVNLSRAIDSKFINANVDLKDEIYAILRYNDHFCATQGISTINVSFIPKEDVHHIYFRLNKKNHRGISDLSKAITPAMLYCLLYLSDIIARIGRGQDKRIYYVRQNVETNVAKTLLNVINQIKKGNMGMRQLENMNSIFNIIGKFNDHVIPMSQNGDPPIQFEVMQGQQVETPTDLLDRLEDMAVGTTDVPLEFVQTVNQVDYATRFTMSNSKFLRKVFKRQSIYQKHLTNIFRKLYNFEYRENEMTIKVMLPAPAYLTLTNTQQLIDNNRNYVQGIADIVMSTEDDEEKAEFINLMIRKQLGTYIDFEMVDSLVEEAKHVVEIKKLERQEIEDDTGGDYGGGNDYGGDDDEF